MGGAITVNRARVPRGAATRGDVERWFGRVPVERLGLAADEILYVPRLRMRIPAHAGAANGRIPDLLLEALRAQITAAGHSWRDRFVPGEAYRFASRSRYFAWLVALWARDGSAAAHAAFEAATGHATLGPWQRATVLRDGPELVATIARLAEIGCAARWLARFEPADIALAYRAIEMAFGLPLRESARPALVAAPTMTASHDRPLLATPPSDTPPLLAQARAIVATIERSGNAWATMPIAARALLLAASVITRSPARPARQAPAFAAAILALAEHPELFREAPIASPPEPSRPPAATRGARAKPASAPSLDQQTGIPAAPAPPAAPAAPAPLPRGTRPAELAATPLAIEPALAAIPSAVPAAPKVAQHVVAPPASPQPLLTPGLTFDTGFGGLLFLINAFVALGLYPDFTRPLGARLDPSPLWLVDRIGRTHFGARYRRDALATWIAANSAPGRLPPTWRAEPDWLTGFEIASAPRRTRCRSRVTLWHPSGFPLFDGLERILPHEPSDHGAPAAIRLPTRDRWAACLALYLDARLRLLTGKGLALLEQPAHVRIDAFDVHARFDLAHHPIELRLAGLDRDPGWQPAEGRRFAFTFA